MRVGEGMTQGATETTGRPSSQSWAAVAWPVVTFVALVTLPPVLQLVVQGLWVAVFARLGARVLAWSAAATGVVLLGFFLLGGYLR